MGEYTCEDWAWSTDSFFPRSLSLSPPSILITWPSIVPPQQPSILPGPVREAGLHDAGLFQRSALHLGQDGLQVKFPIAMAFGFLRCFLRGMHLFKVPEQNLIASHLVLICQSQDDLRIHWFISIDWWVLGQWRISSTFLLWGPRKQLVFLLLVRHLGS